MMQKTCRVLALTAGIFLLALFCAVSVFLNSAADGEMYFDIQKDLGVECGVDDETMHSLDILLGRYLAGDGSALDETELFNADEKAHMKDVFDIFAALRLVKNSALAISVVILVAVYYNRAKFTRGQLRGGIIAGLMLLLLPLTAAGVWAAIDFDSAFTAMHHLLFSNELWLMDPATDLMIRMLPGKFFMTIGLKLALRSLIAALAAPVLIFAGTIDWKKPGKTAGNE